MSTPPLALPLTPQQRGVYFLHCLAPDSAVYNVPVVLRVRGPLDPARLQRAVDLLRLRHDALRLTVEEHEGDVRQLVHTAQDAAPVRVGVTARPGADPRAAAEVAVRHAAEPFDLVRGPLWRVDLVSTAPEDHALVFSFHHIVVDEISATTLAGELHRAYQDPALLDPAGPEHSYARFCAERPALPDAKGLDFWRRRLDGLRPLPLPEEHVPGEHGLFTGDRVPFTVPAPVADRLAEVCRTHRVSEFMVFHAVLQVLLHRWTGSEDIAVGTPMSGRTDERFLDTVGFFQNTVVLRRHITPDEDFAALLKATRRTVLEALQHQETPFEAVVDALRPAREGARNPLFQVALVFNRRKVEQDWTLPGLTVEPLPFPWKSSHFDLTLTLQHDQEEITGSFAYGAQRLTRPTAARLASMYLRLLEGFLDDPRLTCGEAQLQSPEELAQVLALGRAAGDHHVLDDRLRPLPQGCYGQVWTGDPETGEVTPTGQRARFGTDGRLQPWRDPAEAALAAQPGVADALVAEEAGDRVGYVVPAPGAEPPAARELLTRLQQRVAAHMLPQRVVLCAELPTAPDGLVDPATVRAPAAPAAPDDESDEKPRGETERCVAALFEELLGVAGLGRYDDFFDYGGHSLLAVRLAGRIGEQTGRDLPVSVLMKTPTVRGVAAALDASPPGGPGEIVQLRLPKGEFTADGRPPVTVVLLHPVGGTLLCYDELLARLPGTVPVAGLERAAGPHPEDTTYAALVDRYATAVAAALPGRRIALVGWSLGGVLAHSVAARLTELGHEVALLALIDSLAQRTPDDRERMTGGRDLLTELASRVEESGSDVVGADDTGLLLMRRLGVDPAALRRTPPRQAAAMLRGWGELLGLAADCRPVPVAVPTRLYLCSGNPPGYPDELAASWRGLTGTTARIPVPGTHTEALDTPAADVIAADLARALDGVGAGS